MTQCGEVSCRDVLVGDIVVPPCCPQGTDDQCGLDLDAVSEFMPVRGDCVRIDQPGNLDSSCPEVLFDDPTERRDLPGCCTPEGSCGVMADLSLLADFGCVDPSELLLASSEPPESCTPDLPEPEPEPVAPDDAGSDAGSEPVSAGEDADARCVCLSDSSVSSVACHHRFKLRIVNRD
jgi:hypothetical protein